jgi:hypothetical protein
VAVAWDALKRAPTYPIYPFMLGLPRISGRLMGCGRTIASTRVERWELCGLWPGRLGNWAQHHQGLEYRLS